MQTVRDASAGLCIRCGLLWSAIRITKGEFNASSLIGIKNELADEVCEDPLLFSECHLRFTQVANSIASCCTVFRSSWRFFAKRWSSERNQKKMTLMSPKSADIAIPHAHRLVSASTTLIARQATLRHFQNE